MDKLDLLLEEYRQQSDDWRQRDKFVMDKFIRCVFIFTVMMAVAGSIVADHSQLIFRIQDSAAQSEFLVTGSLVVQDGDQEIEVHISSGRAILQGAPASAPVSSPTDTSRAIAILLALFFGFLFLTLFCRVMVASIINDVHLRHGSRHAMETVYEKLKKGVAGDADRNLPGTDSGKGELFAGMLYEGQDDALKWFQFIKKGRAHFRNDTDKVIRDFRCLRKIKSTVEHAERLLLLNPWQRMWTSKRTFRGIVYFYWLFYRFSTIATLLWLYLLIAHLSSCRQMWPF